MMAARNISDPEVRDAAVNRVESRWNEIDKLERDYHDQIVNRASTIVEESSSTDGIHRGEWLKLTVQERSALETRARQLSAGIEPETDIAKWYDLQLMAVDDPQEFMQRNLMQDRPNLGNTDFQNLARVQAAMREGTDDGALNGWRTMNQVVDETLPERVKGDARNEFRRQVEDRVIQLQQQTGKEASTEDVQAIADELAVKGRVPGGWFGALGTTDPAYRFEVGEDEFTVTGVDEVPRMDREAISIVLRSRGKPVTDESILDYYNRGLR
jgi:hypothetical protein